MISSTIIYNKYSYRVYKVEFMKYTSLKSDIINILHSSDYNLNLKFYDEDGNTTIKPDDAQWGYINNNNIIIEFMTNDIHTIYIWKDKSSIDNNMKTIIQRIRELAILNGVSVQIRVYDNLDQRKIYNLIKSSIASRKDDEKMNESLINQDVIIEALQTIVSTAKNTKKASDFYMSESILNKNSEALLREMIEEIKSLKNLNKLNLSETLNQLFTVTNIKDIQNIVSKCPLNCTEKLEESSNDIKNIAKFVRQQYLNNVPFTHNKNTLLVLENVKVYDVQKSYDNEGLIHAYNKLIEVSENATDKTDLLKAIKQHKIEETYNIKSNDLLNFWLEKDGTQIRIGKNYIIENYLGIKESFDDSLAVGISTLAKYFNNGGERNSTVCQNIINETIKYNDIADFINNYKNDYNRRKYIPKFKKLFNETIDKLSSKEFNQSLFESVDDNVDYTNELNKLSKKVGISHNALKYLAIEEAKQNIINHHLLMEEKDNDIQILIDELKNYVPYSSVIACYIVENRLGINYQLNESSNDDLTIAKSLYSKLSEKSDRVSTSVSSALFGIINMPKKLNENKHKFLQTLIKYC